MAAIKKVVFACVHNAGRSQIAAAFFNALADPSIASAISAGTHPLTSVHPEVVSVMAEIGIDLSSAVPQRLTSELAADATMLITMGCGDECPYLPGVQIEDWPIEDPKALPVSRVRDIRDDIRARVVRLIERISS